MLQRRVAVGGPAPSAHVQRPGGVGADELHVHRRPGAEVGPGVAVDALGDHLAQHVVQPAVVEVEVHETRPRHLHLPHVRGRIGGDVPGQLLRQIAGVPPGRLGAHQRHVGGPVAVLGASGAPDLDRGRQRLHARAGERATQSVDQMRADHRANPLGRLRAFPQPLGGVRQWQEPRPRPRPARTGPRRVDGHPDRTLSVPVPARRPQR